MLPTKSAKLALLPCPFGKPTTISLAGDSLHPVVFENLREFRGAVRLSDVLFFFPIRHLGAEGKEFVIMVFAWHLNVQVAARTQGSNEARQDLRVVLDVLQHMYRHDEVKLLMGIELSQIKLFEANVFQANSSLNSSANLDVSGKRMEVRAQIHTQDLSFWKALG